MKKTKEYKKGFEDGYHKCMHDFNIVHGDAAEKLIQEVENPSKPTKEQEKFLKECLEMIE